MKTEGKSVPPSSKICFIICVNNDSLFAIAKTSISTLHIPEGMEVEVIPIYHAASMTSGYNQGMSKSDAKYKVYLHQDVFIIHRDFIIDLINLFKQHTNLGLVGMIGARSMPISGVWWESEMLAGKVFDSHSGVMNLLAYGEPEAGKDYISAQVVDGLLMATQYDVPWREDCFTGWHFYDVSHCYEFRLQGYEVGIPRQVSPWCIHDCGIVRVDNGYEAYQAIFKQLYGIGKSIHGHTYYQLGMNSDIHPTCDVFASEGISLGNRVKIQRDCWLLLPYNNVQNKPRIVISDDCDIGRRCNISAVNQIYIGPSVIIAPNVHISDHNHEYRQVGVPIRDQGVTPWDAIVSIGEGCWIGTNVVIAGNVKIGKGCVIGANSVLSSGTVIPDYCVVVGAPAVIVKQYNVTLERWEKVSRRGEQKQFPVQPTSDINFDVESQNQALTSESAIVADMEVDQTSEADQASEAVVSNPLMLSICIPTYNRAEKLADCLASIYSQIGSAPEFEVIVSDDASTDDTLYVLEQYKERYPNFKYVQQEHNLGADDNLLFAMSLASGQFIMLHRDQDQFQPDTLADMYRLIVDHQDCSVIYLDVLHRLDGSVQRGEGVERYLEEVSIYTTFISSIILRKEEFSLVNPSDLFITQRLNQVYLQLAVLSQAPKFCIYYRRMFQDDGYIRGGYSFAEIFIKNYLHVLKYFEHKGLSTKAIQNEKYRLVHTFLLWWYEYMLVNNLVQLEPHHFEEIFREAYSDEPYFEDVYTQVVDIRNRYPL